MMWELILLGLVAVTPTPTPDTRMPREALELQFFCKGTPVPDTAVYGIDFKSSLGASSVELPAEAQTKPRLRVTRSAP